MEVDREIGEYLKSILALLNILFSSCSFVLLMFFIVAHQILRMFPWASDSQINNDYEKLLKNDEKPLEKSGAVCQDRKSRK